MKKAIAVFAGVVSLSLTPVAFSHLDQDNFHLSYRQSVYALLGANFGPMNAMIKGDMPWSDAGFQSMADDLAAVARLNVSRGFQPGTDGGKTRAKPAVWDNLEDVNAKWADLGREADKLAEAAKSGDRAAIIEQFKATGGACKACHDDYKSKDYLN